MPSSPTAPVAVTEGDADVAIETDAGAVRGAMSDAVVEKVAKSTKRAAKDGFTKDDRKNDDPSMSNLQSPLSLNS